MPDIEKAYKELAKRHALPSFEEMDREFEISFIESERFLMRSIISAMMERIEFFAGHINSLLHPDNGQLSSMHECRFFDDRQKEQLFTLYKALMEHHRKAIMTTLSREEKAEGEFISSFWKEWKSIKPQLLKMVDAMQKSWKAELSIREELGYLG